MGEIVFKNISKSFGTTEVIKNLDLTIKDGSFTVLVGASGNRRANVFAVK